MPSTRFARTASGATAARLALFGLLCTTLACRDGERPVVFPPDPDIALDAGHSDAAARDGGDAAENRAPVARNLAVELDEDTLLSETLPVTEPDGDALEFELAEQARHGVASIDAASGEISYTPEQNYSGADSFRVRVSDGRLEVVIEVSVDVLPVNDAPTGDDLVLEGDEDSSIDFELTGDDVEGDPLEFEIYGQPQRGILSGTAPNLTYTPDPETSGEDSFSFRVNDGSADSEVATVVISVASVNDVPAAEDDALTVAEGATATLLAGGAEDSVLHNDSDQEDGALSVDTTPTSAPSHGTLVLQTDGTFSYTHDGGDSTSDSFGYEVCDDGDACSEATVAITILPVNDAPVAVADSLTVAEGGTATMLSGGADNLFDNDLNPEADTLTASVVTSPTRGTLALAAGGTFSYEHDGSENFADSFEYRVCDDAFVPLCDTATVTITITPANEAPVATAETITVGEGDATTALTDGAAGDSVLANDTDPEDDGLTASVMTSPTHGTLALAAGGTFTYTHLGSENFTDSFVYSVCDDGTPERCDTQSVSVTITPVNDAPVTVMDSITVAEGGSTDALTGGSPGGSVLGNDTDAEDDGLSAEVIVASNVQHGTLTLNPDGTFTYTHLGGEESADGFSYEVCDDGTPSECATGTVSITITAANDAPVGVADSIVVDEGESTTALEDGNPGDSVLTNDTDAEDHTLSAELAMDGGPVYGMLTLNTNGTFTYTHDGTANFSDSFTYRVCDDGTPSQCDESVTVSIAITPLNDAPVGVADSIVVDEGENTTALEAGNPGDSVLTNDTDTENDGLSVDTTATVLPQRGTLTLNADGTFDYEHGGGEFFTDSFSYDVCDDGVPSRCDTVAVSIVINPVNDAPVANTDTISLNEGATATTLSAGGSNLLTNDTDVENDALTVTETPTDLPDNGTVTLSETGTFSYVHDGSNTTSDSFSYEVCDDGDPVECVTGTVTISIDAVNDTPDAVEDDISVAEDGIATTVVEDAATSVRSNDTDADNDTLTITLVDGSGPSHHDGTFTLSETGTFSYDHDGSENFTDSFTYQACDPTDACDTAVVTITIGSVNDLPNAQNDSISVAEDGIATTLTVMANTSLLANDTDPEGTTLVLDEVAQTEPEYGELTLNANGTFSYDHDGSENFTDSFVYTVCDSGSPTAECSTATVNISITPVNDAPVGVDDAHSVAEGGTIAAIDTYLLGNDTDAEDDSLEVMLGTGPSHASSFTLHADSTFDYTHDGSETTSDSFTYTACDDGDPSECSTATTVTITITGVNDAPTATDDAITLDEDEALLAADSIDVRANDDDPEDDALTASLGTGPLWATSFSLNADGTFAYDHDGSENHEDSFTYRVCETGSDPAVCSGFATVTITLDPVNDAPIAPVDGDGITLYQYSVAGNTLYTVAIDPDPTDSTRRLKTLDTDPDSTTLAITGYTPASTADGVVSVNTDGTFTYLPPVNFTGVDTFTYTVSDDADPPASTVVTVRMTVSGMYWYVDHTAAGGGDGRSSRPFNTLLQADATTNGTIYVKGTGPYTDPIALAPNQVLHGQGVAFNASTTVAFGALTRPQIDAAGAAAVTLASGTTVQGINVTNTGSGNAIAGAALTGSININNATLVASSSVNATALSVSGAAALTLTDLGTLTGNTGMVLSDLTSLTANSGTPIAITATNGPALSITRASGTTSLAAIFGALSSTTSSSFGVQLSNVSGSLTAAGVTVSNPATHGVSVSGATGSSTFDFGTANVTQSGGGAPGDAYAFSNNPSSTITFSIGANPNTDNGRGLFASNSGTLVIPSAAPSITAAGGAAVDVTNTLATMAGLPGWHFNTIISNNSTAHGLQAATLTQPFEVIGSTTISNPASPGLRIADLNGPGATLSFQAVSVNNRRNVGILVDDADGATASFGAITIPAPNAAGATFGALEIQNSSAAVTVTSTTITSADTAIALSNNTGAFTLNADGAPAYGGGTLLNSTSDAIVLNNVRNVTLYDLDIDGSPSIDDGYGIHGTAVDGLAIYDSRISDAGNTGLESAITLLDAAGILRFDTLQITNSAFHAIDVDWLGDADTADLDRIILSSVSVTGNPANDGSGFVLSADRRVDVQVIGSTFTQIGGEGVEIRNSATNTSLINARVEGNTFTNSMTGDSAIELRPENGSMVFLVENNTISNFGGHVIVATIAAPNLSVDGTIRNNSVTADTDLVAPPNNAFGGQGIRVFADANNATQGTFGYNARVAITNNTVANTNGSGITVENRDGAASAVLHALVTGNAVNTPGSDAYRLRAAGSTLCARVGDVAGTTSAARNNATGVNTGMGFVGYFAQQSSAALFQFEATAASAAAEIQEANDGAAGGLTFTSGTHTLVTANTTCQSPTAAPPAGS